jgi:hypothetical protein
MANRPQQHKLSWPLTPKQVVDLDDMLQTLFKVQRNVVVQSAALTEQDDTNVTLTLVGDSDHALLQAVELVLGWVGTLSPARGGTGIDASGALDGQLLIGATSDHSLALANLTAGTGITITNSAHGITIALTGGATADYVVASDGATPTPAPLDDGFGSFIYVTYTP